MQGISTKLSASVLTVNLLIIINYVLFEATWGLQFPPVPTPVAAALATLVLAGVGYFVPERAPIVQDHQL